MKTKECDYLKGKVEKLKKTIQEYEYGKAKLEEALKEVKNLNKWRWGMIQKLGLFIFILSFVAKSMFA